MNKLKWSATVVALVVLAGIARLAAEGPSGAIRVTYSSDGSVPRAPGLSISYRSGDPAPQPILAQVASSLGSIPFDVSVEGAAWLSVTASSYITPATLTITANPAGLTPGTYSGSYTVHTAVASGGRIFDNYDTSAITLIVQPPPASTPSASPTSLTFNGTAGQPVANQTFNLSSAPSALGFSVTPAATWLGVSSGAGVTAAAPGTPVTVSVTTAGLSAGIYQSSMAVHLPGGTPAVLNIPVTLNLQAPPTVTITSPATPAPTLAFSLAGPPAVVPFTQTPQVFTLAAGSANLPFTATTGVPWLSVSGSSAVTPASIQVALVAAQLPVTPGNYTSNINLHVSGASPADVNMPVSLQIATPPAPTFTVFPPSLSLSSDGGHAGRSLSLTATFAPGVIGQSSGAVQFTATSGVSWLALSLPGSAPASLVTGTTPTSLQVTAVGNPANGSYNGTVAVTASYQGTPISTVSIPVSLVVSAAPFLSVSPSGLVVNGISGQRPSGPQANISISNTATTPIAYTVAPRSAGGWLSVGLGSGTLTNGTTALNVTADPSAAALPAGSYDGAVDIAWTSLGGPQTVSTVPVKLTVSNSVPPLQVTPSGLQFTLTSGSVSTPKTVNLSTNPGSQAFTLDSVPGWLKAGTVNGQGSQMLSFTADATRLGPGTYAATVQATAGSTQVPIAVALNVTAPTVPQFAISPSPIALSQQQGSSEGTVSSVAVLTGLSASQVVNNPGIEWSVITSTQPLAGWLSGARLNTSSFPFTITVFADGTGLAPGTRTGNVTVIAKNSSQVSASVPVSFTITARNNSFTVSPSSVSAQFPTGADSGNGQITLAPASEGLQYAAVATVNNGGNWLSLTNPQGAMPAQLGYRLDLTKAGGPGLYTGQITITASGQVSNPVQTVSISVMIPQPPPARLVFNPVTSAGFSVAQGSSPTADPVVAAYLSNSGSGDIPVTITSSTSWLRIQNPPSIVGTATTLLMVELESSGIPATAGAYTGVYHVVCAQGSFDGTVSLQLTPAGGPPRLSVAPAGASVSLLSGVDNAVALPVVSVTNTGNTPASYSVATDSSWLSFSSIGAGVPLSGTLSPGASTSFPVYANAARLSEGTSFGSVTVTSTNSGGSATDTYAVTAAVTAPEGTPPILTVSPSFYLTSAQTFQLTVTNPGGSPIAFTSGLTQMAFGGAANLTALPGAQIAPVAGSIPARSSVTISVTFNAASAPGLYGNSAIVNAGGAALSTPLLFASLGTPSEASVASLSEPAAAACTATTLLPLFSAQATAFRARIGDPAAVEVLVIDNCGKPLTGSSVLAEFSNNDQPISLVPVNTQGLWTGTWLPIGHDSPLVTVKVTASDPVRQLSAAASQTAVLDRTPVSPIVRPGGIVNGSDFGSSNTTAPGGVLALFGLNLSADTVAASGMALPNQLSDVRVFLGSRELLLYFASPFQINVLVPYDITSNQTFPLTVKRANAASLAQDVFVASQAPSLFLADADPTRLGIIVDQRGTNPWFLPSLANPAVANDFLTIYCLGLGSVDQDLAPAKPTPATPLIRTRNLVTVTIGGIPAPVSFAGLAPTWVGLYQVNVQIPAGVAPGNRVPIVMTVNGQSSQPVTIPVR